MEVYGRPVKITRNFPENRCMIDEWGTFRRCTKHVKVGDMITFIVQRYTCWI